MCQLAQWLTHGLAGGFNMLSWTQKNENLGHVSSIYKVFSYLMTPNEYLCAYVYQNSLPVDLSFSIFTPNSGKVEWRTVEGSASTISAWWKSWFLFPWRWPMAQAIHMKLILKLEEFQYHLWHRFTQDEEYPSLDSFRCKKLVLTWYPAWVSGIPCLSRSFNRLRWGLKDWQPVHSSPSNTYLLTSATISC